MDIYKKSGTKERLFEMFENVNKIKLDQSQFSSEHPNTENIKSFLDELGLFTQGLKFDEKNDKVVIYTNYGRGEKFRFRPEIVEKLKQKYGDVFETNYDDDDRGIMWSYHIPKHMNRIVGESLSGEEQHHEIYEKLDGIYQNFGKITNNDIEKMAGGFNMRTEDVSEIANQILRNYEGQVHETSYSDLSRSSNNPSFENMKYNYDQNGNWIPEGYEDKKIGLRALEKPMGSDNWVVAVVQLDDNGDIEKIWDEKNSWDEAKSSLHSSIT